MSIEKQILAGIMINNSVMSEVDDILLAVNFEDDEAATVFCTMRELYDAAEPIDIITISNTNKSIDIEYLASLVDHVSTSAGTLDLAKELANRGIDHATS